MRRLRHLALAPISAGARPSSLRRVSLVAAALLWGAPVPLHGQVIVGVVQEAGSGSPVAGALVRLLDGRGGVVGSFLTAADGRYRLAAAAAGPHALLVERIGYERSRIGPVEIGPGGTTRRNLVVAQRPIELEGLRVEGSGRRCDLRDEGSGVTQVVWAQVRTALEASTWTKRDGNLGFRLRGWERRLDQNGETILDEAHRISLSRAGNSVRSLPAEELAAGGYVRATEDGMVEYFAPDAEALLSDSFLAGHCFSVRAGKGAEDGLVGLDFEPVADRDTTDVRGTIWVERRLARLERIDFEFVGLSYEVGEGLAGGRIEYVQLPDGRWVVEEWRIQAPAVVVVRSTSSLGRRDRQMVEAVYETGAEVVSVRGEDFEWRAEAPAATVRGTVYDSTAARPLPGAEVRVAGRGWTTRAGPDGSFRLEGVPEGRYRVLFQHPRLDSLGLGPRGRDVELGAASETEVWLAIPSRATLLAETCPAAGEGGAVVGWVTDPDGSTPVAGAELFATDPAGTVVGQTSSGLDGAYRICGVPAGVELTVEGRVGAVASETATVRVDGGRHGRADLTVSAPSLASGAASQRGVVGGTVRDASDGRALPGATVEVRDADGTLLRRTVTDGAGRFRIVVQEAAPVRLRFSSLGYGRAESRTLPAGFRQHRVQVELSPEALAVEGVVVRVEGRRPALEGVGFYERRLRIDGDFLDREELGLESARRVSDALQRIGGIQRLDASSLTGNTTRQFVQFRSGTRASQRGSACMPAVYVDGSLARWGEVLTAGEVAGYPTLDELVSGADVEAVELYDSSSSIPPEFMGPGTLCGAIVVWTRR